MLLRVQLSALKETTPKEYALRFLFGGLLTVVVGLVADKFGPVVGGMFLAFPGIFPAAMSLVETHKKKREAEQGKEGTWSARGQASVEATGASAGTFGLMGFALVLWRGVPGHALVGVLVVGAVVWALLSWSAWWVRERM